METREADRYSTILGLPCRIMMPLGTPKPREECQPFTYEIYTEWGGGEGSQSDYRRYRGLNEAGQSKAVKGLSTLYAAYCSRCGKKGKNCSESRSASVRHACLVRQCA